VAVVSIKTRWRYGFWIVWESSQTISKPPSGTRYQRLDVPFPPKHSRSCVKSRGQAARAEEVVDRVFMFFGLPCSRFRFFLHVPMDLSLDRASKPAISNRQPTETCRRSRFFCVRDLWSSGCTKNYRLCYLRFVHIRLRKTLAEESKKKQKRFLLNKSFIDKCLSQWLVVGFVLSVTHIPLICHVDFGGK
jgi:hypothetical protein